MIEQVLTETYKASAIAGLLLLAVIGLIAYIKTVDKRNMNLTNERINDLKSDVKESKDEIKAMKEENIYNYCHIAGRTDIGCKRQANEDSMGNFETINGLAAVVCDGMGGHVGGATASRLAVEAIHGFLDGQ